MILEYREKREKLRFSLKPGEFQEYVGDRAKRLDMEFSSEGLLVEIYYWIPVEHKENHNACGCGYVQKSRLESNRYGGGCYGSTRAVPAWLKDVVWSNAPSWWMSSRMSVEMGIV